MISFITCSQYVYRASCIFLYSNAICEPSLFIFCWMFTFISIIFLHFSSILFFFVLFRYYKLLLKQQQKKTFYSFFYVGAVFLEMWKRYSADITHRWDLTGFDTCEVSFFMQNWVNNFLNVSFFLWHNSIPISFLYIYM